MKRFGRIGLLALAGVGVGVFGWASSSPAADKGAAKEKDAAAGKWTIQEVMEKAHKGKEKSLFAQVVSGKASAEQKAQLVEYYEAMATDKPDKGDLADWKKRSGALLTAAKAVQTKSDAKSLATLKTAAECKSCHKLYKDE
jgi:hypothetical protein